MGSVRYLHNLLIKREISSRELTEKYLEAIERDNSSLNAFVNVTKNQALSAADEADKRFKNKEDTDILEGIPMALKDNISTRGIDTTCCSKMLLGYKPVYDATAWYRLKEKGAVLLGKTNMDEFAMGSSTENSCFGKTSNPFDLNRSAGGSSGGSAAAVAGNLAVYALGSDTGGSVRQPASFCGIVGLKPTYSSVSRQGLIAFASSLDQIGTMGKSVEDVALVFDAVAGHDPLDSTSDFSYKADTFSSLNKSLRGRTLAVVKEFFEGIEPAVKESLEKAIKIFEELGVNIKYCSMPQIEYSLPVYYILACAEASSNLSRYDGVRFGNRTKEPFADIQEMMCKSRSEGFASEVKRRILVGSFVLSRGYYDAYYKKAQLLRKELVDAFEKVLTDCDAILTPTSPTTSFKTGRITEDPVENYRADICTACVNVAGLPAVSVCCGYDKKGLPVGMQIIGDKFCEAAILNFAHIFESNTDFNKTTDWGVRL